MLGQSGRGTFPGTDCQFLNKFETMSRAIATKIIPHSGWKSSKMINSLSNDIAESIASGEPCSYSWHKKCISLKVQRFTQFSRMKIIAKSYEANDLFLKDFVAMAENEELGWFGTMFHPEKVAFASINTGGL